MRKEVKILLAIAVVFIVAAFVGASYYRNSVQNQRVTGNSNGSNRPTVPPEVLVRPDSPTLGSPTAPVTVVEFLDPECESCASFGPIVKKLVTQYDGKVKLVIRIMPLHPNSLRAATLLEAAGEQGKYWQMLDLLFVKQPEWGTKHGPAAASSPAPDLDVLFEKYAKEIGLDLAKVEAVVKENKYQQKFDRDRADGQSLGVRQTPTLFVNGRKLLRLGEAEIKALIDDELKRLQ